MSINLIELGGYIPPAPSKYQVNYSDLNGDKSTLENGHTYEERIRTDIPTITVGWTNVPTEIAHQITQATGKDVIEISYYYGTMITEKMTVTDRALTLKAIDNSTEYWDVSFKLEG